MARCSLQLTHYLPVHSEEPRQLPPVPKLQAGGHNRHLLLLRNRLPHRGRVSPRLRLRVEPVVVFGSHRQGSPLNG